MMQAKLTTISGCLALTLALMPATVATAADYTICAQLDPGKGQTIVTIDNGCISSSRKYLGNDFRVNVDQRTAFITITGDYRYKDPAGGIGTTDCAGAKKLTFRQPGFGKRLFGVIHNNRYRGRIDLTGTAQPACVRQHSFRQQPQRYTANGLAARGFATVDPASWPTRSAASLIGIFSHPESTEGRPTMRLEIGAGGKAGVLVVEITQHGLLDDSVSAQRFVGHVKEGGKGWQLVGLWKQSLCARGERAGQWTPGACS